MERMKPNEFKQWLEERTKNFSVSVLRFLDSLDYANSTKVISYQLGRSASSIGANYREANRAVSRDDCYNKIHIALKEASESCYWLEILFDLHPCCERAKSLYDECIELRNLLQKIAKSIHWGRKSSHPNNPTIKQSNNPTIKQSNNQAP